MLDTAMYKIEELPYKSKSLLKWMWYFIKPFKVRFFLLSFNRIIGAVLFLSAPIFVNHLINFINSDTFKGNESQGYYYFVGLFIAFLLAGASLHLRKYDVFFRNEIKRRITIFTTVYNLNLPLSWHENQGTGNKMQRILRARESFHGLLSMLFQNILKQVGAFIIIISALIVDAPIFISIIFILYIFIFILTTYLKSKKIGLLTDIVNIYYEKVIGKGYEFASNLLTAKFFNLINFIKNKSIKAEAVQMGKIFDMINEIFKKWIYLNIYNSIFVFLTGCLTLNLLINGDIDTGTFVMIIWFSLKIQDSTNEVGDIQDVYIDHKSGFMLLTETLSIEIEKNDFKPYKKFPKKLESISLKNLSYSYGTRKILKNINLEIKGGEKIAIVGKSGSGKSTFIKILMKQITLKEKDSDVLFNNSSIRNIRKNDIIKNTSIVLQEIELFNMSIKDNITLDLEIGKKEKDILFKKVVQISHCDDFINKLEEKEETIIGDKGIKLSGGEKQRIGIARALIRQSKILIFDEATSSLDSKSESIIQKEISEIFKGKTSFVIAHRLSTIKTMDRILVFKNGNIVEDGTFEELINLKGEFKKLWELQKLN